MYTGSDNGLTETYMMPGTHPNPQITLLQAPEGVDYMANELVPEVIYDQGLYYPAADYYGYFCTGLEPQSEWNDQQRFFGVDGQELDYPQALQTESSPYVYYSPSYGYAQSSYNPYNPYIPGAVMGLDGPIIGTQQYFSDPSYQLPVSSPTAYMPVIVQPNLDVSSSVFGTVSPIPSRQTSVGSKYPQSRVSSSRGAASQGTASNIPKSEPLHNASSKVSINVPSGSVTQMTQGRTSGLRQATDRFPNGSGSSFQNPSNGLSSNLLPNFGTSTRGWAAADRFRPRFQFNGITKNGNGGQDILGEQNRGPRTNKSKGQWAPTTSSDTSVTNAQAIVICADQYNRGDFPVDYPDAKFFIIKSYSEDDVHKSIKYNVWSSTPNGNKRLNSAYEDAHKLSAGKPNNCPIFLFFSVNASGQFCGAAEMIGPVDFDKDMDFWQQDKWTGSFPVKWHMIKDVPNTSFRHIVLENNENKPVTNSRDTQEIMYEPGMNMLNIFKSNPLKTSILDDFMFYEERQKIMQEEKSRYTGRSYNTYVPAIVSANKPDSSAEQNDSINEIAKKDEGQSSVASDKSSKSEKQNFDVLNSSDNENPIDQQVAKNPDVIEPSSGKKDVINVESSVMKMKSLSLDSKEDNMKAVEVEKSPRTDFVTVGSMLIEVNGSFPIEPKVAKLDEKGVISDENSSHQ